ncbi:hypothetical protein C8Q74DRAFT_1366361 [Fomes fomentarius]|nr:hypothetical protein C8Q74DRAFT_1366361 [Fomes fomentarius]
MGDLKHDEVAHPFQVYSGLYVPISASPASRGSLSTAIGHTIDTNSLFTNVTVLWTTRFLLIPSMLRALPHLRLLGIGFDKDVPNKYLGVAIIGSQSDFRDLCPQLVSLFVYDCGYHDDSLDNIRSFVRARASRTHNPLRRLAIACPEPSHAAALALGEPDWDYLTTRPGVVRHLSASPQTRLAPGLLASWYNGCLFHVGYD